MPNRTHSGPLPFNVDLGGLEPDGRMDWSGFARVQRAFARKAWSWGLPVRQSYRDGGLVRVRQPAYVPQESDRMMLFDRRCLEAMGREDVPVGRFPRRDCVYALPSGQMTVHFSFADGSNPFVKFCPSVHDAIHELSKWARNYEIMPDMYRDTNNIAFYILAEKKSSGRRTG